MGTKLARGYKRLDNETFIRLDSMLNSNAIRLVRFLYNLTSKYKSNIEIFKVSNN